MTLKIGILVLVICLGFVSFRCLRLRDQVDAMDYDLTVLRHYVEFHTTPNPEVVEWHKKWDYKDESPTDSYCEHVVLNGDGIRVFHDPMPRRLRPQ